MQITHRKFKDEVYGQIARAGKALAAPRRLELLDLLAQAPRTVEGLAGEASMSVANASRHLQVLRAAGLVAAEKRGVYVEYRLADEEVARFAVALRELAESRLADVERITRTYFERRGLFEAVQGEDLVRRVRAGAVTILDVRPVEEYEAGHIPGARSIPVTELEACLRDLPRNREVVAYCRGPYCVMAAEAVQLLRQKGFTAHRMEQGVSDWRARGWHLATGNDATRAGRRPGHRP